MTIESRLTDVEEALRSLRDADRLQGRPLSTAAPGAGNALIWNNTTKKWEPSLIAPTLVIETATSDTSITANTDTDITGCSISITPTIASTAIVWMVADVDGDTIGDRTFFDLDVDGADESATGVHEISVANDSRATVAQIWPVNLTAAAHTIKLQGRRAGSGTVTVFATNTRLMLMLIDDENVTIS